MIILSINNQELKFASNLVNGDFDIVMLEKVELKWDEVIFKLSNEDWAEQ